MARHGAFHMSRTVRQTDPLTPPRFVPHFLMNLVRVTAECLMNSLMNLESWEMSCGGVESKGSEMFNLNFQFFRETMGAKWKVVVKSKRSRQHARTTSSQQTQHYAHKQPSNFPVPPFTINVGGSSSSSSSVADYSDFSHARSSSSLAKQ